MLVPSRGRRYGRLGPPPEHGLARRRASEPKLRDCRACLFERGGRELWRRAANESSNTNANTDAVGLVAGGETRAASDAQAAVQLSEPN
jgi:hypothetical protein